MSAGVSTDVGLPAGLSDFFSSFASSLPPFAAANAGARAGIGAPGAAGGGGGGVAAAIASAGGASCAGAADAAAVASGAVSAAAPGPCTPQRPDAWRGPGLPIEPSSPFARVPVPPSLSSEFIDATEGALGSRWPQPSPFESARAVSRCCSSSRSLYASAFFSCSARSSGCISFFVGT